MTPVSIVAILLSFAALGLASSKQSASKLFLALLLLVMHFAASLYYYTYSLTNVADASVYYFDPYSWGYGPWGSGSRFVTKVVHQLRFGFGATYLDCFLLFQAIGFAGMLILARVFDEIQHNVGVPEHRAYWALLFLPSVNFWTSAIGKDAPLFFALSLCAWAMLSLRNRFLYFVFALLIMVAFRAHIALIATIALAGSALLGSSTSMGQKIGVLAVAAVGIWATSGAVDSALGVDTSSVSSVSDYLDEQNSRFSMDTGSTSVGSASFPLRLVSLLFRPFFFDAQGALGVVASVENVGAVLLFIYLVMHWRDVAMLVRRVPFVRFAALYAVALLLVLTLVYYNVGLGLRQRVMAYPMIFSVLVALWSVRAKYHLAAAAEAPKPLMVNADANRAVSEL